MFFNATKSKFSFFKLWHFWNIWPEKVDCWKKLKRSRSKSLNFAIVIVLRSFDQISIADCDLDHRSKDRRSLMPWALKMDHQGVKLSISNLSWFLLTAVYVPSHTIPTLISGKSIRCIVHWDCILGRKNNLVQNPSSYLTFIWNHSLCSTWQKSRTEGNLWFNL